MHQVERRIASVSKAFDTLDHIARSDKSFSAKDLSLAMAQPLATMYHLLNTLVAEGAVIKGPDRRYRLGPRIGFLGSAYVEQGEPTEAMMTPLRELAAKTGETAYLSVWRNDEITVAGTAEGSHAVRVAQIHTGVHGHAHARASGKLLLAHALPSQRRRYLESHELLALTPHTLTSAADLEHEFARILEQGYATDREEFALDVSCVAAPIILSGHTVGAFTVSCPTSRFVATELSLIDSVKEAAQRAEQSLMQHDPGPGPTPDASAS